MAMLLKLLNEWHWRQAEKLRDWWDGKWINVKILWWIITHPRKEDK
jgi:hypothetical protein